MTPFFTYADGTLFVKLLIAHCVTDFLLQPNKWVADKKKKAWRSAYLYFHVLFVGSVTSLLLSFTAFTAVVVITLTHLFIDGAKLQAEKYFNNRKTDLPLFLIDQLLHIIVLILVWLNLIHKWNNWTEMIASISNSYSLLLKLLGYILVTTPVGFIIQFLTRKWTSELNTNDSLPSAGKWIGILERVLILTMVFINQFSAIGFLVAAKSILRVTDKPEKPASEQEHSMVRPFSSRKHTEYVLIGTFISVAIAIFIGLIINKLIAIK